MVEMGTDRMHHGFWKDMDPTHRKHEPGGRYERRDPRLPRPRRRAASAELLATPTTRPRCSSSPTTAPSGWTAASGSTSGCAARACSRPLREPTEALLARATSGIDWTRTTAWGEGGYYARVFLNVEGPRAGGHDRRRPTTSACATSSPRGSRRSPTTAGAPIATQVYKPEERVRRGQRRRARPDRPLRRPALALRRHRRRRRGHPHVRERHRARTTRTTPRTAC